MAKSTQRTVLITGCSDGSLGSQLALAFHQAGWRTFATARNPAKLKTAKEAGIETLILDVLSEESIENCVSKLAELTGGSLDMLVNNSGAGYSMPLLDVDLKKARNVFELNVFSLITVSKAFFPLLRKSAQGGAIVNNTSCSSLPAGSLPFQGSYNASKAAAAGLTETLRLELEPFGIRVINLVTGAVKSTFHSNTPDDLLPRDSIYNIAKERVERTMSGVDNTNDGADPVKWAKDVVASLSKKSPSYWIWEGKWSTITWLSTFLPIGTSDRIVRNMTGIDVVAKKVKESNAKKRS